MRFGQLVACIAAYCAVAVVSGQAVAEQPEGQEFLLGAVMPGLSLPLAGADID